MRLHGNRVLWAVSAWHPSCYPLHQHQPGRNLLVLRSLCLMTAAVTIAALQGPSPPAFSLFGALCTWTLHSAWACVCAVPPGLQLVFAAVEWQLLGPSTIVSGQGPAAAWVCSWAVRSLLCVALPYAAAHLRWPASRDHTQPPATADTSPAHCGARADQQAAAPAPAATSGCSGTPCGCSDDRSRSSTGAVSRQAGEAAQGPPYSRQEGADEAAGKELPARSLRPVVGLAAGQAPPPLAYTPTTCRMTVSMKVDVPHEQLQEVGTSLLDSVSRVLARPPEEALDPPCTALVGTAAVFKGCVQLVASMFAARQQPLQSAGADAAAQGALRQPAAAPMASGHAGGNCRPLGLAAALVQDAVTFLWKGGARPGVAASADGQLVMMGPAAQGSTDAVTPAEVQPGEQPAVPLVAFDPPCATAGVAGSQELYVGLKSSQLQGSCRQGRLVVCGPRGVVLDQQPLEWVDSIRFDLPELPPGVCQVALLPVASSTAHGALAATCRALLCEPLLVLPAPVASELQQHWRCILGAVAAGAPLASFAQASFVGTAGLAGTDAAAVAAAGVRADIPTDGSGRCRAFKSIMSHAWTATMSGLLCDLSYLVLASTGADLYTPSSVIDVQPQPQWLVSQVTGTGPAHQQLPVVKQVSQHLLQHLELQGLSQTAEYVEAAAADAEVVILSRGDAAAPTAAAAAASPGVQLSGEEVVSNGVAAAEGIVPGCSLSGGSSAVPAAASVPAPAAAAAGGGTGPQVMPGTCPGSAIGGDNTGSRALSSSSSSNSDAGGGGSNSSRDSSGTGSDSSRTAGSSSDSEEPVKVPAQVETAAAGAAVPGRYGLAKQWLTMLQLLACGFQPPALELAYLEEMYHVTFTADVTKAVFLLPVALSFGTLTDPYPSGFSLWDCACRLLFVALFSVPSILLLAFRQQLRHGDRRERAQLLVDWCRVGAAWMMPLGVLPITHGHVIHGPRLTRNMHKKYSNTVTRSPSCDARTQIAGYACSPRGCT